MTAYEQKTRETDADVAVYVDGLADERQREDSRTLIAMMSRVTGQPPKMWGPTRNMVGFGSFHYVYASGHEGDTFVVGFAPRKAALTLYLNSGSGFDEHRQMLDRLGKHKLGKGCLYITRLADVDTAVLEELVTASVRSHPG